MNDFNGKVAAVTGSGSGIGAAIAQELATRGARVMVADIDADAADRIARGINHAGGSAMSTTVDVADAASIEQMVKAAVSTFGALHLAVNNAGIGGAQANIADYALDDWHKVIDVNLNGVFWCNRAFGRHMLKAGRGAIVNIGSMSGYISNRPQKQTYYNASKAAVHQMTSSLAAEWADRGVRINAVAPTYIETEMTSYRHDNDGMIEVWLRDTPMHRMGKPDEIASVVHFLASDAASLMTGETVLVDGGFTCW